MSNTDSYDKTIITLPSQLALLNSEVYGDEDTTSLPLWDKDLVSSIEKAAGIAGFSQVLVMGYAIPLVKEFYTEADSLVDGQYVFVVEVTNSGFILSPVGRQDIYQKSAYRAKLSKHSLFIPLDLRKWFKEQVDAKPEIMKLDEYYTLDDDVQKTHYINSLLAHQSNDKEDKEKELPMAQMASTLLSSLKAKLREKIGIPARTSTSVDPLADGKRGRDLDLYEHLFKVEESREGISKEERVKEEEEMYKKFFGHLRSEGKKDKGNGYLVDDFVPYAIVTGAMAGNTLLAAVFEDAFSSLFKRPKYTAACRCEAKAYTEVAKAASKFSKANPKFAFSPGYEVFDEVTISFPQSTKEQKEPISLDKTERPMLIRRLVPDVSKRGSKLTFNISCLGRDKPVKSVFDFRIEKWHLGSRVEAELVIDSGDRLILSTYLNGEPFEVQLLEEENFEFRISRLSPGVYELFCSDEHKLHWDRMNRDNTLS